MILSASCSQFLAFSRILRSFEKKNPNTVGLGLVVIFEDRNKGVGRNRDPADLLHLLFAFLLLVQQLPLPRDAQGRHREMLWRRHLAEAEAAGQAEGRQKEDEADRPGLDSARRLYSGPQK